MLWSELQLELFLEAQDREVLRLDRAPRVVRPVVQQPERPQQRRFRRFRPPERSGEVDPAARIRVDPGDPRLRDVARSRAQCGCGTIRMYGRGDSQPSG